MVVAGLAAVPLLTANRYHLVLITLTLLWMGFASCWNIVSGFLGYVSFGHAALFGLGAYIFGIGTARYGLPILVALPLAFALVGMFSLLFGILTLRIRGHYFAIATLGLAEVTRITVEAARGFTRGTFGFGLPVSITGIDPRVPYYVALAAVIAVVSGSAAVLWSDYGARLLAIREDETAAASVGISPTWHKLTAFVFSGALSGLLGGVFAWVLGYLTPDTVFAPLVSLQVVVMVIIGGMGTLLGPLVGGAAFYLLGELVLVRLSNLHLVGLGIILVVAMLFMRRGIVGTLQHARWWPKGLRL